MPDEVGIYEVVHLDGRTRQGGLAREAALRIARSLADWNIPTRVVCEADGEIVGTFAPYSAIFRDRDGGLVR